MSQQWEGAEASCMKQPIISFFTRACCSGLELWLFKTLHKKQQGASVEYECAFWYILFKRNPFSFSHCPHFCCFWEWIEGQWIERTQWFFFLLSPRHFYERETFSISRVTRLPPTQLSLTTFRCRKAYLMVMPQPGWKSKARNVETQQTTRQKHKTPVSGYVAWQPETAI